MMMMPEDPIRSSLLMTSQSVQLPWNFVKAEEQLSSLRPWKKGHQWSRHLEESRPVLWGRHVRRFEFKVMCPL
jgi:hypothetical protein